MEATRSLPRDEFTARRRELRDHPEAVHSASRIDVEDPYGSVVTWVLDLVRVDGAVTAFVQRGATDGYDRLVIPPKVTAAIARHQQGLVAKQRKRVAKRVVADRRARGEQLGNAAGLEKARAARKKARATKKKGGRR